MITAVLDRIPPPPTEGASSRIHAILDHLRSMDPAFRVVVAEPRPRPGRSRLLRLARGLPASAALAARALRGGARLVIVSAPALPWFETPSRIDLFLATAALAFMKAGSRLTGARLVLNLHDFRSLQLPDFGVEVTEDALAIFRALERRSVAACDYILAPGGEWPGYLRERFGVDPRRLVDFPNGCIRVPETGAPPSDLPEGIRFVYAGTMTPRARGLEELVAAFRRSRHPGATLLLLGPGGEWSREAAGGDGRIHYLGARPVEECVRILRTCHAALYPYPDLFYFAMTHTTNKMALYLTCGLPVLAYPSRAVARFIEEKGIGLTSTPEELPARIDAIAERPSSLEAYRAAVAKIAGDFHWDVIIDAAFAEIARREGLEPLRAPGKAGARREGARAG